MRMAALVLAIVALAAPVADAQGPWREGRAALLRPVVDGRSLAGLELGMAEAAADALFGAPIAVEPSPLGDRALRYEPMPGLTVTVHTAAGAIRAIGVSVADIDAAPGTIATTRGIRLGTPVEIVGHRYGDVTNGPLWYAASGVAFNFGTTEAEVREILVFAIGTTVP